MNILFEYLPLALKLGCILLGFFLADRVICRIINKLFSHVPDHGAIPIFLRITHLILFTACGLAILKFFEMELATALASIGALGAALALAFKTLLGNLISGVLILLHSPFKIGDIIKVSNFEGRVEEIGLRCTILQNDDEQVLIYIPNSTIYSKEIKKWIP